MAEVYINHLGINAERCPGMGQLSALINATEPADPVRANVYVQATMGLGRDALAAIEREDRSVLSSLAAGTLNAIADALGATELGAQHEAMHVYSGNDSSEYNFSALCSLMRSYPDNGALLEHIGEIRKYSNPMNMMRLLSTNPVYHTSKRLCAHGGGYPIRAMSLSGLCALEDAWHAVAHGRAPDGAAVVAAGNMRSFDALVAFGKMGLLHGISGNPQVDPTYGAAALLLDAHPSIDGAPPWAELLDVDSLFAPEPFAKMQTWSRLFERTKARLGMPDVIVAYRNGAQLLNESENGALALHYPDTPTRSYKKLFGYTGKPNNLLDLAAVLVDASVPAGAIVMINGTGFGWGVGAMTIRKLARPTVH